MGTVAGNSPVWPAQCRFVNVADILLRRCRYSVIEWRHHYYVLRTDARQILNKWIANRRGELIDNVETGDTGKLAVRVGERLVSKVGAGRQRRRARDDFRFQR